MPLPLATAVSRRWAFVALAWSLGGVACRRADDGPTPRDGLVAALARLPLSRTTAARVSIDVAYRACPAPASLPMCPTGAVDPVLARRVTEVASRAAATVASRIDPDALRAVALVELLFPSDTGKSLARAISLLRRAAELSDRPAPILGDLAAALLARGTWAHATRDVVEAIDVAAHAVALAPRDPAARYDLALALDVLGLPAQATPEWTALLMIDSTTGWATEARERLRRPRPRAASLDGDPQRLRIAAWDTVLGRWGDAALAGDVAAADAALARADTIGAALAGRGGDATVADAVRAIRATRGRDAARRRLARAHHAYAAGQAAFAATDYAGARREYESAAALAADDAAVSLWARTSRIAALVQLGLTALADTASRPLVARLDTVRAPALAARARWVRGTALARARRAEEALALFRASSTLFARAGEVENAGIAQVLVANALYVAGNADAMHDAMADALATLRDRDRSVWLHNLLYVWATATVRTFPRAAARLEDEDITVAATIGSPASLGEARLARARFAADAGDRRRAATELAAAAPLVQRLPPGRQRDWMHADLQFVRADVVRRDAGDALPRATVAATVAAVALDSAVDFFREIGNRARLVPSLVARADARFAGGRERDAEGDLEEAVALVTSQHDATMSVALRMTTLDAARRTVDRLVMRRVADGRVGEALAYADRGRASIAHGAAARDTAAATAAPLAWRTVAAPAGQLAVEMTLVGDTLLTWVVDGAVVRLTRATVDRARLARLTARVRAALELRSGTADVRPDLAALYDVIARPIASQLGADRPLVWIADGEIGAVPIEALYDGARGEYLVERHVLRFVGRLRDAAPATAGAAAPRALLVGAPALDAHASPELDALPGADAEAARIAADYPGARVLAGAAAERGALLAALAQADVAHFAGHAVFDDAAPERSYLALAASSAGGAARLTAADVAALDLRHLRLVVLSACQTSRAEGGRMGGFTGLTGAFLAAGAGGVVGSLWRVDDALTVPLMADFHHAYRTLGDGAAALRVAQLRALRSGDPARRSPAAWAGFRYTGS